MSMQRQTFVKFELRPVEGRFELLQNDRQSEQNNLLGVPGLESLDFHDCLMKIGSNTNFEKLKKM